MKDTNYYLCRPKSEKGPAGAGVITEVLAIQATTVGKKFFEIMKYNNQARYGNLVKITC